MRIFLLSLLFGLTLVASAAAQTADTDEVTVDLENRLYMELKSGRVVIDLRPDLAPNHVAQVKQLTREGFYDGIVFHRVIAGFMAQTGDPTGTGRGGSDLPNIDAEFSSEHFKRGVLGMARSQSPNSANSQFFIVYDDASWLDGQYTVFGKVVSGMEFVDRIRKGSKSQNGLVENPDQMITLRIAADIETDN